VYKPSTKQGIVILYSESSQINYKRLSNLCGRLADYYLKKPVSIIEIDTKKKNLRTFRYPNGELENTEWNNIGRFNAYELSPYDETLLIDSDYIIQTDNLKNYFGSDHNLICHKESWDVTGNSIFKHDRYMTNNCFNMLWATVLYFKKSKHAENIFKSWQAVYENYKYYSELFGFNKAPFRNDYAMSIAHLLCNGYSHPVTFNHSLPALSSSDSVLDYNNKRWLIKYELKQSHNILRYTGDLHVMNKKCILETDLYDKLWNSV